MWTWVETWGNKNGGIMNRRNRFIVALLSASLTFSAFAFTVGTDHWKYRGWHRHHHGCYHDHDSHSHEQKEPSTNGSEETNPL